MSRALLPREMPKGEQPMRSANRKPPAAPVGKDEELRMALQGLRRILNVIELDEHVAYPDRETPDVLAYARHMIAERGRRYQYFNSHLFSDPAWGIMLDLFVAELELREVPVTNLCLTSNVPDTTVLRWIKTLAFEGLVMRRKDKVDKRRVLVQLSRPAAEAMRKYMEEQIGAAARLAAEGDAEPVRPLRRYARTPDRSN